MAAEVRTNVIPVIPETITVHLGLPNSPAENVTVSFTDYVKNVASSEIYPTWDESALRANILAIMSYALNRVYTEYYRSRGYDFDITNTTARDQAFVNGRSYFENISRLVDEMVGSYIRRVGSVEPLAAKFCNGTTSTCDGLSQWGSEALAQEGLDSVEILKYYYGDDIEIVTNAPMEGVTESYPGTPLRLGSTGPAVTVVQTSLNRISQSYPAIPKINPVDGIYGPQTKAAVEAFQQIFALEPDGIVGRATWYQLVRVYVAVTRLAELQSEGQQFLFIQEYPEFLSLGDRGQLVEQLQYMLLVISSFVPTVQAPDQTGVFDNATLYAVRSFQRYAGLPVTGSVGKATWDTIFEQFNSVDLTVFEDGALFPAGDLAETSRLTQFPGAALSLGSTDGGMA
ncbi:MAG TPA: peptidoglycan-binding protein [Candidatus Avoscillospira avicola]|uniref:Peptidoglycan-binding protein n=1 Tax=Candidatus Avoscillospira avicola TaxID=2840706 RepID=A0A9D1DH29_9FIRM|nr:peptidoglycan-binding protein [Candidatus Avoscillospira avicola]